MTPQLYTTDEVAEILRVHRRTVIDLIAAGPANGGLAAINIGSTKTYGARWRVSATALDRFLSARQAA